MNFKKLPWTEAEDDIMRADYKRLGSVVVMGLLPGRTRKAIEQRAVGLGISHSRCDPWTEEEDAMLLKFWPEMGAGCSRMFPNRTKTSVQTRARKMRIGSVLARKPKAPPVPEEVVNVTRIEFPDDEPLVKTRFDKRTARGCYGFIPGGPVSSIFHLASAIGGNQP
jgi:hypothetical protein